MTPYSGPGGRAQLLADAVAMALVAALCADAEMKQEYKDAVCGLDSVAALLERTA